MRIYLLRHGIAEDRRADLADEKRALTAEGRARLHLVLARARAAQAAPSLILTSPLLRSAQTARLAAAQLGRSKVIATDALLPSATPEEVWREVRKHSGEAELLLAGHEPLLSETASWMLGSARPVVELKKGAMLAIGVEDPKKPQRGVLEWLLSPKLAGPIPK